VALTYLRDQEAAESVLRDIEKTGRRGLVFKADTASRTELEGAVAGTLESWGGLDILVNNAGIWTYLEMGDMDEAVYRETMAANLDGVFLCRERRRSDHEGGRPRLPSSMSPRRPVSVGRRFTLIMRLPKAPSMP
jgi:3-oxoacyl-[acyl-carrier protein] reductase